MSSDSSPNETSRAAQPGGQPDAPVHAFYLASAITARRLRYTLGGTSRGVDTLVAYPFIAIVVGKCLLRMRILLDESLPIEPAAELWARD